MLIIIICAAIGIAIQHHFYAGKQVCDPMEAHRYGGYLTLGMIIALAVTFVTVEKDTVTTQNEVKSIEVADDSYILTLRDGDETCQVTVAQEDCNIKTTSDGKSYAKVIQHPKKDDFLHKYVMLPTIWLGEYTADIYVNSGQI